MYPDTKKNCRQGTSRQVLECCPPCDVRELRGWASELKLCGSRSMHFNGGKMSAPYTEKMGKSEPGQNGLRPRMPCPQNLKQLSTAAKPSTALYAVCERSTLQTPVVGTS